MRKNYLRNALVGLSFIAILSSAIDSASGSGPGYSNAPNDPGGNCSSCHGTGIITSGNSNLNKLRLEGNFTGNGYIPDSTYTVSVTFKQTGISKFGFEITCLDGTNSPAGSFNNKNSRTQKGTATVSGKTRQYIYHTSTGSSGVGTDSSSWTFEWVAPSANIGNVKFYVVVNAANNNGTDDAGDIIYGKVFTMGPSSLLPKAIAKTNDSVTCAGSLVQMTGSGTNSPTSYSWKFLPSAGASPSTSTSQNPTVTFGTTGTKMAILTVKNSKGTGEPDTQLITVNPSPSSIIIQGSTGTVCKGDSMQLKSSVTSTGYSWTWLPTNKTGTTTYVKDTGSYRLKMVNLTTGCTSTSAPFRLNWYPIPTISISKVNSSDSFCDSYNETITATGNNIDSVLWYVNGVLNARTKSTSKVFTGTGSINVQAIAKNTAGCKTVLSNTVKLIAIPKLDPTNIITTKTTSSISLSWTKTPGITKYSYSLNKVNYLSTTTDSTLLLTGLLPNTSYDITIRSTQASPCGQSDLTLTIKTNACSNLTFVLDANLRTCKGNQLTTTVRGLYKAKYAISFNNLPYSKDTIFTFTPVASDSLPVNIIDSLSPTCPPIMEKIAYKVDTFPNPDTTGNVFTANICSNAYLYTVKSGYGPYEFFKNNVQVGVVNTPSFNYTGLQTGDKLTARGFVNTCVRDFGPATVKINTKPVATFGFTRSFKTYTFTATDGSNSQYDWWVNSTSLGNGNPRVNDFSAYDNSTVSVKMVTKNAQGCTDSSSQSITVPHFSSVNQVSDQAFNVFPNPFDKFINIVGKTSGFNVRIVNNLGQVVYKTTAEGQSLQVNTAEWATGVYQIVIESTDKSINSFTFIKS